MTVRVTVRDISPRHRGLVIEKFDSAVDSSDEDALADLLRRTAKRHGMKAGDVELDIYDGRRNPKIRV